MSDPRYPIGRFTIPDAFDAASRQERIATIASAPDGLRGAIEGLTAEQIDTPYRDGGWTVRQLVHHVADSHVNAYCRHKLVVAEDEPTIRAYDEKTWAELPEVAVLEPGVSLALLYGLHARWAAFLAALPEEAFARVFHHPEMPKPMSLDASVALYAWHGRHHTAHITQLRAARGW